MSSERGFTVVELMVAIVTGIVVIFATFALVDVATRNSARVAARIEADQRARPVLQHLVDELHSTCLGPTVTPVQAGSTPASMTFLSQTGAAVNPIPDKHVVTLAGSTLSEAIYPATGGTTPNWTFATAPSSTRQLLTGVGPASSGSAPSNPPLFQYFSYQGSQLSSSPLPTPLSAADAAQTTSVVVAFSASPSSNPTGDPNASVSLSDAVTLRLSPAAEDASEVNPPCA